MKAKYVAGALAVAALAAPATASAHNSSTWKWTVDLAERKAERMYPGDGQVVCVASRGARFARHFGCADDNNGFMLHVIGKNRFTITNVEAY